MEFIPQFASGDSEKPQNTSFRVASPPAEIRTRGLLKAKPIATQSIAAFDFVNINTNRKAELDIPMHVLERIPQFTLILQVSARNK
jgi:hypothetical protein